MLKLIKKTGQAGVTLLETILVLSLISIIMVGGLKLYGSASDATKLNKAIQEITQLTTNVRSLYSGSGSYAAIGTNTTGLTNLRNLEACPDSMNSGTTPETSCDKNVYTTVAPISISRTTVNSSYDAFTIAYNTGTISNKTCIKLGAINFGQEYGPVSLTAPATAVLNHSYCDSGILIMTFK